MAQTSQSASAEFSDDPNIPTTAEAPRPAATKNVAVPSVWRGVDEKITTQVTMSAHSVAAIIVATTNQSVEYGAGQVQGVLPLSSVHTNASENAMTTTVALPSARCPRTSAFLLTPRSASALGRTSSTIACCIPDYLDLSSIVTRVDATQGRVGPGCQVRAGG